MTWTILATQARKTYGNISVGDLLGFLPAILRDDDPRPVKEQLAERYAHGGGWSPFGHGQWILEGLTLTYPGDSPMRPVAQLDLPLSKELVVLYPHSMVLILQPGGDFEVVRLD